MRAIGAAANTAHTTRTADVRRMRRSSHPGRYSRRMSDVRDLLHRTADLAADFLDSLDDRPVFPQVTAAELQKRFDVPLTDEPQDPAAVIEALVAACDAGLVAMPSGRYFGFVIGGGIPAALAADWLTSAWDQNAGLYAGGPSASVVEEVARRWLCGLLALPPDASAGFVTGTQMAHVTGLAAARFEVLQRAGWVVGVERADSWTTDAHKWLNVPYDSGLVFCAHPDAHRAAMAVTASYLIQDEGARAVRDQMDWVPEFSRRARGFAVYAALRSLGRSGVAELVERCCACARRFAAGLVDVPGAEVLNDVVLNQVLFRFESDERTDAVLRRVQDDGAVWMSGTIWNGRKAIRLSISNWQTGDDEIDLALESF